jgi:hypothetical protein
MQWPYIIKDDIKTTHIIHYPIKQRLNIISFYNSCTMIDYLQWIRNITKQKNIVGNNELLYILIFVSIFATDLYYYY